MNHVALVAEMVQGRVARCRRRPLPRPVTAGDRGQLPGCGGFAPRGFADIEGRRGDRGAVGLVPGDHLVRAAAEGTGVAVVKRGVVAFQWAGKVDRLEGVVGIGRLRGAGWGGRRFRGGGRGRVGDVEVGHPGCSTEIGHLLGCVVTSL